MLVSVDPGLHQTWWAYWNKGGRLERVGRLKNRSPYHVHDFFAREFRGMALVIEFPIIVRRSPYGSQPFAAKGSSKFDRARPKDILNLAAAVGWVETAPWVEITRYEPAQWGGGVPKDIKNKRAMAALSHSERAVFDSAKFPKSLAHNAQDACGIGLHHLRAKGLRT